MKTTVLADCRSPRAFLHTLLEAGLVAVDPNRLLPPLLPALPRPRAGGRTLVLAAGKAASAMAQALESCWNEARNGPLMGLVVTRYGYGRSLQCLEQIEAAHPVPDGAGAIAAKRFLAQAEELEAGDVLLCLISGGASSLLAAPTPGLSMADKQAVTKALLASGAPIQAINTVRRHLSAIKGGRLALAAAPAQVVTLLVSDVVGDDPAAIASGPTVGDPTSCADALAVLDAYGIEGPPAVRQHLRHNEAAETPFPEDTRLKAVDGGMHLLATSRMALDAAAETARSAGVTPLVLGDRLEGEAQEMAKVLAGIARSVQAHSQPVAAPAVILSGGEATVTLGEGSRGRGGPNTEFLLALALALRSGREASAPGLYALAADTDGIDGSADNAGALLTPDSLARAQAAGLDAAACLAAHDAYRFFAGLDDLLMTGPTGTNINDFRAILIP